MATYGNVKILNEVKKKAELRVQVCISEVNNNSWIDLDLEIGGDHILYFGQRLMQKDYNLVLELFNEESDSYLKKIAPIPHAPDLYFYGGLDKEDNRFLGFNYHGSILYFVWNDLFFEFMKSPEISLFNQIQEIEDTTLNHKQIGLTATGKADKILQSLNLEIENHQDYQYYSYDDKEIFFVQAFEYRLKQKYNISFDNLDELDHNNISYLLKKYFESTL